MIYFKMFTYVMVIYHIVDELICVEEKMTLQKSSQIAKKSFDKVD